MVKMRRELIFMFTLWKANVQALMEYRASFLTQIIGMVLNNGMYFLFWVLFFEKFNEVRGWQLPDMMQLFGVVASGFGLCHFFFGNMSTLSEIIAFGQLDYYLSLPRPVLLHVLASKSYPSSLGDLSYGFLSFILAGQFDAGALLRFCFGCLVAGSIFLSFSILVHALSFWVGNAQQLAYQANNAIITFSIYPISLFDGPAKFILFTIIPAAFIGALPAEFVAAFSWQTFLLLLASALLFLSLAIIVFQRGLRRYESGSTIQTRA
jgi:ABC-2 type transport system permease protein